MGTVHGDSVELFADLSADLEGFTRVALNVGPSEDVYVLLHRGEPDHWDESTGAVFAKLTTETAHDYRIIRINRYGKKRFDIHGQNWNFHFVQPLSHDRLLLVSARSERRSSSSIDKNAQVFDSENGLLLSEFTLGDGIEDVQTTENHAIWVSYFDEGVYGNYGWDEPIGSSGLNCFNDRGDLQYAYRPPRRLEHIDDCYALNITSDAGTWFYYYSEYVLVHLRRCEYHAHWDVPIDGSSLFAVDRDLVLMRSGYGDAGDLLLIQLQEPPHTRTLTDVWPLNTSRELIKPDFQAARGPNIYLMEGPLIYRLRVRDFL